MPRRRERRCGRTGTQVVDVLIKEISVALLQSDVNIRQVKKLQDSIRDSVKLDDLASGLNRRKAVQQVRGRPERASERASERNRRGQGGGGEGAPVARCAAGVFVT